ncbi:MAG TPA: acyl-CoA dehydrogenase family protein, partial [Leptolyngbya sp.]|nr:acyl-CoA dehydrogenase family protein [Leptolyngbya sp.]
MNEATLFQSRSRFRPLSLPQLLSDVADVAEFCAKNAANIDHCGALPIEEFDRIAKAGLLIAPLKPEFGGLGLGIQSEMLPVLLSILQQIGRSNLAIGRIYEGHVNALQLVQTFGTKAQIAAFADDVIDRHKIFGVWNAEANDGVKLFPSDQTCRIEGSKTFCSGTGLVDRPFVNGALPDGGWQMAIVPMEEVATVSDPSWWQPLGMRATASFKVDFTGVELNPNLLLGEAGDYFRQPWLSAGVVRFAAVQLGGAEALFDATRNYLQELGRTQDPYQAERLGKMAIAVESGNLWLQGAADR